jgi:hypothetical protein
LLERALIEDNCKYIKRFMQKIPILFEFVVGYNKLENGQMVKQIASRGNSQSYLET